MALSGWVALEQANIDWWRQAGGEETFCFYDTPSKVDLVDYYSFSLNMTG
ncbi:MAG: hypothetical protein KI793_20945 [Rivularia sp. (in: Bacteria)]|nr:hypothetical protein [Rivularia sp. MS3]